MPMISDFWKFIKGKLMGGKTYEVSSKDVEEYAESRKWNELCLYEFAIHSGINIIANALSACEIRTFANYKEIKGDQYYLWNYEPNLNMNASQFKQKLVSTLINKNECLVIQTSDGRFLIADSYNHKKYAMYQDVFSDVTVNLEDESGISNPYTFRKDFKMQDVLYYRLSNRNITVLLQSLMQEYSAMLESAEQNFLRSGGERGILSIDANASTAMYGTKEDGSPRTFNDVYEELVNKQFATYFKAKNAALPLFKGFDYQPKSGDASKKSTSEVKDVTDLTDEVYDRVANALQIPPALLRGDVADVSELTRNLITFAIDPIAKMIETENNRKLYGKAALNGSYQMIDTSTIMHMTAAEMANASDKMIACGGWSIDEIRKKSGDAPLNEEWSTKHFLTKNYSEMDVISNGPQDE